MSRTQIQEWFIGTCIYLLSFFAPSKPFLLIIGFMVSCDMVTGIIAAYYRGEQIRSRKLARTVSKFIAYGIAILIAFVISDKFFPTFPAMQLMGGYIAFIEIKSIDENIKTITGYSLFKAILEKLKSKQEKPED